MLDFLEPNGFNDSPASMVLISLFALTLPALPSTIERPIDTLNGIVSSTNVLEVVIPPDSDNPWPNVADNESDAFQLNSLFLKSYPNEPDRLPLNQEKFLPYPVASDSL